MDLTFEGEANDRLDILLPPGQIKLIDSVMEVKKRMSKDIKIHLVVVAGGALDLSEYAENELIDSIIM